MTSTNLNKAPKNIASMFDKVAKHYDLTNDLLSLGQSRVWQAALKAAVDPQVGMKIIDVAAGTGTSSALFSTEGADVVACDISPGMIEVGKTKHPDLEYVQADATALPFAENTFDAVVISYGLRNMPDPTKVLNEMYRVTKNQGKLVVCEFSKPTIEWVEKAYNFLLARVMPIIGKASTGNKEAYEYLAQSILEWPDQYEIAAMISDARWKRIEFRNISLGIVALHRGIKTQ